jgi:hypothetical protein
MLKRTRKVRTGVRASRRMRTSRCVRPHASRRIAARSAVGAAAFAFRCDAPQHEGEGRSTNLRLWETIAGSVRLFPDCYLQWMAQLQRVER